ncbi:MAG TPA: PAS domain S-box protein [Halanaerobiales bacterium]|nr:PAS domain S-box protein [Halanaerobiales bacterium]
MTGHSNDIFNNINDIVWSVSWPDLKVKFVSKAVKDITGYSREKIQKNLIPIKRITHPEDKKIHDRALKQLKENGYEEREFRIISKEGNIKWIHDRGEMIYNKNNEPIRAEGIMRDITERKEQRKELEMMDFTLDKSSMLIFRTTPEGIIDYVNETVLNKLNYDENNLIGKHVKKILKKYNYVDRIKFWEKIKNSISMTYEREFITKKGNKIPVEMTSQYFKYEDREYEFAFAKDITERKKLEKNLKEKNELFNSVLESIQDGISVLSSDLTINYINSTMKEWYKSNLPLKGKKCFKAYYNEKDKCKNCPVLKTLETGKMERQIKKQPEEFELDYIEIFSYPIWDENEENMTGVVEFVRDISDRLKQREKLEMMNFTVNKSNLLIFRVKSDGIIEYVNDTVLDKLEYKREDLVGNNTKKIVKAKDNYIEREKFWNRIKESKAITYERKFITKSGNKFPVEITSQYYNYEDKEYEFVFAKDITKRKEQEKKIKEQKAYFEQLFNNSTEAIVLLDNNHRVIKTNKKFESLFGFKQSELKNKNLDNYILPENLIDEGKNYTKRAKQGEKIAKESIRKTKNGQKINVYLQGFPIKLANGHIGIYAIYRDITERKKREEKIEYLSYKDQLTDLYNRRFFEEEMKRLDTQRKLPISIIMADLNGLKIINDSYGHEKGDEILKRTAKILKNSIRKEDVLARQGGDEFAILLPQTQKDEAQEVINRIKRKTDKTRDEVIPISIALGVATKENKEQNIDNILKKADDNMYQNKLSESRSSKSNIVQGLLNTLSAKSPETKEHTKRMAELSKKLGNKLKLSNSELNKLSLLATLHDIGKTTISEKILNKSENLSKEEWKILKEHSETGYKIATASNEFSVVAEEILSHHENWDGSGYPRGIKGENIPYLARIISIIDAYDVMTTNKPYSKAISKKAALNEIKECAGSQFDPELAQKFIELKK